jgi:gamma-glutamyltranspeptidase/glutathione hydrolase
MNVQDAVDLPRFHQQWKPDVLYLETGFPETTQQALEKMGYEIKPIETVARVEAIVDKNGLLQGGTESRNHGKVAGY